MFTCGAVSIRLLLVVTCRYSGISLFRYTVLLHPSGLVLCDVPQRRVFCARDFHEREYFVSCVRIVFGQRLCRAAYTSPVKLSALFRRVTADICVVFVTIRRKICVCQEFFVPLRSILNKRKRALHINKHYYYSHSKKKSGKLILVELGKCISRQA